MKNKLQSQTRNLIIFLLLAINTILLSSYFYKKFHHEKLSIEILNGCGEEKIAAKLAERLAGYNIYAVENADHFNYENTMIYASCKKSNKDLKKLCADIGFNPDKIIFRKNDKLTNVTVIVGLDYPSLLIFKIVPMQ